MSLIFSVFLMWCFDNLCLHQESRNVIIFAFSLPFIFNLLRRLPPTALDLTHTLFRTSNDVTQSLTAMTVKVGE
jgi:hypothetical protein